MSVYPRPTSRRAGPRCTQPREPMHRILRHIELVRDEVPAWDRYPSTIPAVANLTRLEFADGVTIFVGENGS